MAHTALDREQTEFPPTETIQVHLDSIINSTEFRLSKRASEFLRHVVEHAVQGDNESLKERILGIEIFHRRADYDTSTDSIVRVTANDVRKRLTNYYADHPNAALKITLPLGTYVPEIEWTGGPLTTAVLVAEAAPSAPTVETVLAPTTADVEEANLPQAADEAHATLFVDHHTSPFRLGPMIAIAILMVSIAALGGWWFGSRSHRVASPDLKIYEDLLGPIGTDGAGQTEIALSNPRVILYRGASSLQHPPEDDQQAIEVPQELVPQLNLRANDNQADLPFHYFSVNERNYTGMGEAHAAFALGDLFRALGRKGHLTEARFLNWDNARQQQLVLLGAPHMSDFAQGSVPASRYTMEHDAVRDNHPEAGSPELYSRIYNKGILQDYGLIWMSTSPSGSRILVLAGLTSTGTSGVSDFFHDPVKMKKVWDVLHAARKQNGFPENWQALIRIDARENVPVKTELLSVKINNP